MEDCPGVFIPLSWRDPNKKTEIWPPVQNLALEIDLGEVVRKAATLAHGIIWDAGDKGRQGLPCAPPPSPAADPFFGPLFDEVSVFCHDHRERNFVSEAGEAVAPPSGQPSAAGDEGYDGASTGPDAEGLRASGSRTPTSTPSKSPPPA